MSLGAVILEELEHHPKMVPWVKEGHEYHVQHGLQTCLLCQNPFTDARRAKLTTALDNRLSKLIADVADTEARARRLHAAAELNPQTLPKPAEFDPSLQADYGVQLKAYRGTNVLALWARQEVNSYPTAEWGTFRQWLGAGAQVRNGEKGTLTVFYKITGRSEPEDIERESTTPSQSKRLFARGAYVFNAAQVDGYTPTPLPIRTSVERNAAAEQIILGSGAVVRNGSPSACYIPSRDEIHLPPSSAFDDAQGYYSVALHELTHWTGHEKRCNRSLRNRFGTEAYAAEELVAELGAAFLCAELGISQQPRRDHACYIDTWLKVLRNDKRAIFTAASRATEAVSYLTTLANQTRAA